MSTGTPKPCPFCGKDAAIPVTGSRRSWINGELRTTFWMECDACEARGSLRYERLEAVEAWNGRQS